MTLSMDLHGNFNSQNRNILALVVYMSSNIMACYSNKGAGKITVSSYTVLVVKNKYQNIGVKLET